MKTINQKISGALTLVAFLLLGACALTSSREQSVKDSTRISSEAGLQAYLAAPETINAGDPVLVTFSLTNNSDQNRYLLKWYTPLEGLGGEIFKVEREGTAIPYEGILASRSDPRPEDYILLEPDASVSVEIDLAAAYDFSQAGAYTIEFLSPRISHLAETEPEMAASVDDLGPVAIPSTPITVNIGGGPSPGARNDSRHTPVEAAALIKKNLQEQHPDLNPAVELVLEELPSEEIRKALGVQIFRLTAGPLSNETFLIKENRVIKLGEAFGGQGLTSLEITDLDGDGEAELLYAYSFGSGIHQSRLGMFAPAYDPGRTFEAGFGYRGDLALKKENTDQIAVRVIELEPSQLLIRYLDLLGYLAIEVKNGVPELVLELAPDLPAEVQEKILQIE